MPVIKIDDVDYEVAAGQNLIEAAASVGVEIPHYCYHPGLSVSGNCRMCLVEVKGPRGVMAQIACNTPVAEGLEVVTQSDAVKKMREGVMEFLLLNHPIDCPICDQAGECGLQDYYMQYGLYTNRSTVPKVHKDKVVDVGPLVMLDQERCILCSRCVRFCAEVTETHELVITQRGEKNRIETFPGKPLDNPYSVNVVDLCPVGALTSKDFRFRKRVWFLETAHSLCTGCSRGCNVFLDSDEGQTYRYRPRYNAEVNQWWLCDEGRLTYKALHESRIDQGRVHGRAVSLETAVSAAGDLLHSVLSEHGPEAVVAIGSSTASLEDNFMLQYLLQDLGIQALHAPNVARWGEADHLLKQADKTPNTAGLKVLGIETQLEACVEALQQPVVKLVINLDNDAASLAQLIEAAQLPLIYLGAHESTMAEQAQIVLPITLHAEHYASYVNQDQRLQKVSQAYFPSSDARPAWKLLYGIVQAERSVSLVLDDIESVWALLTTALGALKGQSFYSIPDTGFSLVPVEVTPEEASADVA